MGKRNETVGEVGTSVVLLVHGQQYDATVTEEHEDGTIKVLAISNHGADFPKSRVKRAPADVSKLDTNTPYWTTRDALEAAEFAKLEAETAPDSAR